MAACYIAGKASRKHLVFSTVPAGHDRAPSKIPKKKKAKASKTKKKRSKAQAKAVASLREDVFPTPILAKVSTKDLDSVFLHWKRKAAPLRDLSASEVESVLKKELQHFVALSKSACKKLKGQLRDALVELAPDPAEATAVSIEPNPLELRSAWTQLIQKELDKLKSKRMAKASPSFEPTSFVGSFIRSRSTTPITPVARSHPRGASSSDDEAEYEVLSSTSDDGSTTEDDPELEHRKRRKKYTSPWSWQITRPNSTQ